MSPALGMDFDSDVQRSAGSVKKAHRVLFAISRASGAIKGHRVL